MSKKTRGFVALAWLVPGVSLAMKGENFLLRHHGYGMAIGCRLDAHVGHPKLDAIAPQARLSHG